MQAESTRGVGVGGGMWFRNSPSSPLVQSASPIHSHHPRSVPSRGENTHKGREDESQDIRDEQATLSYIFVSLGFGGQERKDRQDKAN